MSEEMLVDEVEDDCVEAVSSLERAWLVALNTVVFVPMHEIANAMERGANKLQEWFSRGIEATGVDKLYEFVEE